MTGGAGETKEAFRRAEGARGRIALMLPKFSRYGGVEQFGFRLAEGLAARGYAVDFICARQEAGAPAGVRVLCVGRPPGFRVLKMLWFLIRAEALRRAGHYDLTLSLGKTWRQDVSRMGGGPLKIFWKQSERALPKGWQRLAKRLQRGLSPANRLTLFLEKRQFDRNSRVIAVSHLVRDWLLEAHPALLPEQVRVVYNRPDAGRFFPPDENERATAREALARRAGLRAPPPGEERIFVGTATTNFVLKGVEPLIRALALLPDRFALFVAGGRDHAAYSRLARRLGLADRVFFCGKIDDMPSLYHALDIFILPTFYDACSNAVLEALASGCKVLTSASNGAAFFLDEEAVLPDPGDVTAMAARLALFAERPAPPPFVWPRDIASGLEDFMDCLEGYLAGPASQDRRAVGQTAGQARGGTAG